MPPYSSRIGSPSSEERNLNVVRRSARSSNGRSLSSQYLKTSDRIEVCVALRWRGPCPAGSARTSGSSRAPGHPGRPEREQDLDRMARGLEVPGERRRTVEHALVGRVTRCAEARQIALDVDREHGHTGIRQLTRKELERLGLARARGARDQAVPVDARQRQPDAGLERASSPRSGLPRTTDGSSRA